MPIQSIRFSDAGPFQEIGFDFNDSINVLTGPNNTGKTTTLWVLGEILVYPFVVPAQMLRSDGPNWTLTYGSLESRETIRGGLPADADALVNVYRELGYTCFIPAQRYSSNFRSAGPGIVEDFDRRLEKEIELLSQFRPKVVREHGPATLRQMLRMGRVGDDPELVRRRDLMLAGTSLVTDEAFIQKIVDLDYAAYRLDRPEIRRVIELIGSIASEVTSGFPLSFLGVGKDEDGLYPRFKTPAGKLPLDSLSQGTQSVVHCIARFVLGFAEYYDFSRELQDHPAILVIDEIDAHLHPSWQRQFIPTLMKHFKNLQLFCSTHSPLMLAGLDAGQVQLLRHDKHGAVTVSTNESDIVGWSADEILRTFLDVPNPTDAQTARRVDRLDELERIAAPSEGQIAEIENLREAITLDLRRGPGSARVQEFAEELRKIRANIPSDTRQTATGQ